MCGRLKHLHVSRVHSKRDVSLPHPCGNKSGSEESWNWNMGKEGDQRWHSGHNLHSVLEARRHLTSLMSACIMFMKHFKLEYPSTFVVSAYLGHFTTDSQQGS